MTATTATQDAYTVINENLELAKGSRFTVEPGPVEDGALAMIRVGKLNTVGRWFAGIAGAAWIVQPGRFIRVTTPVQVVGRVLPC